MQHTEVDNMKLLVLVAFALFPLISCVPTPKVTWPDAYTSVGRIILPYADIVEPFNVSIDMKNKRGIFDFYNGLATVYYRGDELKYGNMYKRVYVTMNETMNKMTCFKVSGFNGSEVVVPGILPDISEFTYANTSEVEGTKYWVFASSNTVNNKFNIYNIFVRIKEKTPYLFYFKGYDLLLGSHYDEYVIYYDTFTPKASLSSDIFVVPEVKTCGDFPGPGSNMHMSDNLFHELIPSKESPYSDYIDMHFSDFKQKYSRQYINDKEHALRRKHFHQNFRFINSKNRQGLSYSLAINHLADLSEQELKTMRGYRNTGFNSKYIYKPSSTVSLPSETNWWLRGAVTPVKDQGICGSCWSFGTTGTLEGSLFIKTGVLTSLSEQAFMDCSWGQGNNGCDGGESERAYEWMLKNGCLPTELSYGQYLMQDGKCHVKDAVCGVNISKYYNTKSGDVNDLRAAIAEKGPISVAIDASLKSFSFYANGVYYDKDCGNTVDDLDHQVLAVGYGVMDGKTYWLVKNSWSTHWGMDGYVLMSDRDNNCGVATDASFAVIA